MRYLLSWVLGVASICTVNGVFGAEVTLPGDFLKDCAYYVGDWSTEVELDGTVYHGKWTARWSPDGTCLVTHWAGDSPQGTAKGTRVHGWDAKATRVLVVDFGSSGASSIERYTIASNQVSNGEMSGVDADGQAFEATARTVQKSDNFFTWTVTRDGVAKEYRFRRIESAVNQQEEPGPHYKYLKDLEYFVGDWKIEGTMETDFEPLAELTAGKIVRFLSYTWMANKNFLIVSYKEKPGSPEEYLAVIGWDPVKKQIRSWDFNSEGAHLEYVHIKNEKGWVIEGTSVYPNEVKGSYRGVFEIKGENAFSSSGSGTMGVDGKEVQVKLSLEAKRQKSRER